MSSTRVSMHAASGSGGGSSPTAGAMAAASWLRSLGLTPGNATRWHVEIVLEPSAQRPATDFDERTATRFQIAIYSEEWGVFFCHQGRASWIRVTDIAFVHGRDDFRLLHLMPALPLVGALLRSLEKQHGVHFERAYASIKTNLTAADGAVTTWIATL